MKNLAWWLTVVVSAASGAAATYLIVGDGGSESKTPPDGAEAAPLTISETQIADLGPVSLLREELGNPRLTLRELRRIGEDAAVSNPVAAVLAAESIPGGYTREAYLSAVLSAWGEQAGETAARWVGEHFSGSQLADALYFVGDGWADSDPAAAGAWYLENAAGTVQIDVLWEVMESWGRRDPEAAATWGETLAGDLRSEIIDGLADGWAAVDPAAAASFASQLSQVDLEGGFLGAVARQWASYEPEAAAEWAGTLRREEELEEAHIEIGENWARTDPAAAARWAEKQTDSGRARWAREGVARGWAAHDPAGAMDWVLGSEVADDGARLEMASEIVEGWLEAVPADLSEWLDRRSPGPKTDLALRAFSASVVTVDPPAAMAWGKKVSDETTREQHLRDLGRAWLASEGLTAIDEMKTLALPFDPESLLDE